ncbi:uncharacterized protein TNCV_5129631 [Trichonephila clavipes]|nr:uncharacterized protein TNCV_5129631 [Trichonephila clavipes]
MLNHRSMSGRNNATIRRYLRKCLNHSLTVYQEQSVQPKVTTKRVNTSPEADEAHFWLNGYVSKQNCRIWSEVYVETPLHPGKLTFWCALWAGGSIGPYFFKNDEVNGTRYRAMITSFFISELNNHDVQEGAVVPTRRRNMSHSSCHNRFIERHVW